MSKEEFEEPWPNFCAVCGRIATHIHFSTGGCCDGKECCKKLSNTEEWLKEVE